ncbi:MAG: hypothetical protein JEZ00_07735 [Anaerolineaceae bacterium]|nr:hypothetical protein [Anaerolineaceae bacterium]
MSFSGMSIFLWQIANVLAKTDQAAFCKALKDAGCAAVYVKVADGAVAYNLQRVSQNQWDDAALCALFTEMDAAGLKKIGWQYLYGRQPEKEAERAMERIQRFGLQGYVLDAEQEYKLMGADAANRFMQRLRAGSELPLALCSYRFPSLHAEFPWQAFLNCMDEEKGDCHMPQVYWVGDSRERGPGLQLQRSMKELQALKALPVVPIGSLYGQNVNGFNWLPTATQIENFAVTANELGCPGMGWWSWDSLVHLDGVPGNTVSQKGWWSALEKSAKYWQSSNEIPGPTLEERVSMLEEQARQHGWPIEGGN